MAHTSLIVSGATVIDGVANAPHEGHSLWIEHGRIRAVAPASELAAVRDVETLDARGKYVIPGLMNANVHLFVALSFERIVRHMDNFEEVIAESAQVALRGGQTTIFDTWGPRRPLMTVREQINSGQIPGSRIFCAGNIIGFDGPLSADFLGKAAAVSSSSLKKRINSIWVENTGRHLMWLTPEQVAAHVGRYIDKGIDFIKYGSNEHYGASAGAFLAFSPDVQRAMVEEAHRKGVTAQAHTESVEGLKIAVQAGCDLIQHANMTGPVPIPATTLELMARRKTGAVVFPFTQRRLDWIIENETRGPSLWKVADANVRSLSRSGAPLLLANDGLVFPPEMASDPAWANGWFMPGEDNLNDLETGHFAWLKAMEEKGCPAMDLLRAATRNIAVAYGKDRDLGTLEPGKIADFLILDRNPLAAADHYRSIHMIFKDGARVDREALPLKRVVSQPDEPVAEERELIPFLAGSSAFPMCPTCRHD